MRWVEAIPGMVFLAIIAGVLLFYGGAIVWMPLLAVVWHRRDKRGACRKCGKGPVVLVSWRPSDQMYGSRIEKYKCPKGHVYTSGDRRFAEWADF